jgi:hypothetical protein
LPFQHINKSSKNLAKLLHSSKKIPFKKQKLPVYIETGSMIREKRKQLRLLLSKAKPAVKKRAGNSNRIRATTHWQIVRTKESSETNLV